MSDKLRSMNATHHELLEFLSTSIGLPGISLVMNQLESPVIRVLGRISSSDGLMQCLNMTGRTGDGKEQRQPSTMVETTLDFDKKILREHVPRYGVLLGEDSDIHSNVDFCRYHLLRCWNKFQCNLRTGFLWSIPFRIHDIHVNRKLSIFH